MCQELVGSDFDFCNDATNHRFSADSIDRVMRNSELSFLLVPFLVAVAGLLPVAYVLGRRSLFMAGIAGAVAGMLFGIVATPAMEPRSTMIGGMQTYVFNDAAIAGLLTMLIFVVFQRSSLRRFPVLSIERMLILVALLAALLSGLTWLSRGVRLVPEFNAVSYFCVVRILCIGLTLLPFCCGGLELPGTRAQRSSI